MTTEVVEKAHIPTQQIQIDYKQLEMKKQRQMKVPIQVKKEKEEAKPKVTPNLAHQTGKKICKLTHYNLSRFDYFSLTRGIVNNRINDWIKEYDNENKVIPDFCYIPMVPMFSCKCN